MRAWIKRKKQLWGTVLGATNEDQLVDDKLQLDSWANKILTHDTKRYDVLNEYADKPYPFSFSYPLDQKVVNIFEYPLSDNDGIIKIQVD